MILFKILIYSFLFVCLASCKKFFIKEPQKDPEAIFENIWSTYAEEYAPFEERNVDWDAAYAQFRPMVNSSTTNEELFTILTQLLEVFDDGHISLTAPNKQIYYSNKIRREKIDDELFNKTVIKSYLESGYKVGEEESYIYGKIRNENIGYIFFDYVGDNFFVFNEFLDKFKESQGIIVDLRHNQGGDFTYCFSEIGRLTNQSRYVFRSKTKNGKGKNDYTPWKEWYLKPKGEYFNKPIVLLIDRYTISAGERSVMAFKTLPNVTIVGDTTNGAQGTMIGRELANGWFFTVVPQKVELFDGYSYEGIGIAPDFYIKNKIQELQAGVDSNMEFAIGKLK